jgi:hypothetical protein
VTAELPGNPQSGAFLAAPELCARGPALTFHAAEYVDYSRREPTPDQVEIEQFLEGQPLAGKRLLHVGIGNSSFARRFAGRCRMVEGLTVSAAERADALGLIREIPNYRTRLLNKYEVRLAAAFDEPFDLIVDNNLASYACCKHHFYLMLESYALLLRQGGELYTHALGMAWSAGDPCWCLTDEDLENLAGRFGFGRPDRAGGVRVLRRA